MIILGIETSSLQVGCAIGGSEGVLACFHAARGRRHAEALTPAIEFVCHQARIEMSEIHAVAVDIGPGLFTGLRVGVATAKAMAQALRVPMVGLSSLDLLAFAVRYSPRLIVPLMDARRDEVYTATYRHVPGGVQRLDEPRVCPPEKVVSDLMANSQDALLVGDGALRYREIFERYASLEVGTVGSAYPSAAALVELAQPKAVREEFVQPHELTPLYLRQSDAEINWARRETV